MSVLQRCRRQPEVWQARKARLSRKPCEREPIGLMPMLGNSLLLDTSVVVKHFRYPTAVVNKLAEYEELFLPQPALGELYYGAYRSGRKKPSSAGVIPVVVGGSEKWPLQFYPALLMMRVLGKDGMASAYRGDNGGFAGPDVVKAWKLYKELCDLDSFQEGFQTVSTRDAAAFFHDGKAAFHLQAGALVLTAGRLYAADKKGLPEAKLGWFFFPEVQGGKGKANDIFGSV
jgi:hypothetical protein